jgi:two-component system CitB family response regulator
VIRTLIVDDDFRVADVHRGYVERLDGFRVVGQAHTGTEALQAIQRVRPDLVLLDLYLPDVPGLEILHRIHALGADRPDVIVVTAARDVDSLRAAMRGGVVHYLVKPFSFQAFEEKLRRYATLRGRMAQLAEADQAEVDRLFSLLRTSPEDSQLPKGVSEETLRLILDVLSTASGDLNAAEIAEAAGVSRVTARRYLEELADTGRVDMTLRYGGPGRPEHRYRLQTGAAATGRARNDERTVREED